MKVPKYIEEKMHKVAKLSAQIQDLSAEIDAFLESKGINPDDLRGAPFIGGIPSRNTRLDYLTELEYGNDVTDELIAYLNDEYADY